MLFRSCRILSFAAAICCFTFSVHSAELLPGGNLTFLQTDYVPPQGEVIAQSVQPFIADFNPSAPYIAPEGGLHYPGSLKTEVWRQPDGKLVFVYDLDLDPRVGVEGVWMDMSGFSGQRTNVQEAPNRSGWGSFTRSSDGDTVFLSGNTSGQGAPHYAVLATDATQFDRGGQVRLRVRDEWFLQDGPSHYQLTTVMSDPNAIRFSISALILQPFSVLRGGGSASRRA
jgi:hypothetical protein